MVISKHKSGQEGARNPEAVRGRRLEGQVSSFEVFYRRKQRQHRQRKSCRKYVCSALCYESRYKRTKGAICWPHWRRGHHPRLMFTVHSNRKIIHLVRNLPQLERSVSQRETISRFSWFKICNNCKFRSEYPLFPTCFRGVSVLYFTCLP